MRIWLLALLALAGCASSQPPPTPEAPGSWQSFEVGLACTEDVPPLCNGTAPWLTFDRPGNQGQACVQAGECWHLSNGYLYITSVSPGFPLIQASTLDKDQGEVTLTVVSAKCKAQGCYFGPVVYNGERNYRALYIADGQVAMYGPTVLRVLQPATFPVTLGIAWNDGEVSYKVNGTVVWTETEGYSQDTTHFLNPPHLAIFAGETDGVLK